MGHVDVLPQLVAILAVGVIASIALARLRLPSAAGLLLAGALIGPAGFGLVHELETIEVLAEIGVVLLLFTIGLEFSLERFLRVARMVVIGGSLQVGLTGLAAFGIAMAVGFGVGQAVFFGFVFALSSTAIVLRGLSERGETDAPHGRFIIGVLIFQDLCVVPMVLIVPILAGTGEEGVAIPLLVALGKAAAVVVGTFLISRNLVPRLFALAEATRSREVFLLSVLAICIGTAWLTSLAGLSLALGAFLGGMVVADTQHGHRAMGEILPLRDVFTAVFFVSMGLLFDIEVALAYPGTIALLVLAFIAGKAILASFSAMAMRFPARVARLAGVGLAQFGEFGFVLAQVADRAGLLGTATLQPLLAAGILSMFLTPVLIQLSPHVTAGERLLRPLERLLGARGIDEYAEKEGHPEGHVIVAGYGVAGRLLTDALEQSGVPHVVLELNSENVRRAAAEGKAVYYGDVSSEEALRHAGVEHARAVVLLINDPRAARQGAAAVRRLAPEVPVLMRTRYLVERPILDALATDVVYDEVEAGVEMLARVLRRFDVPRNVIHDRLEEARRNTQASVRPQAVPRKRLADVPELADLEIEKVVIRPEDHAAGRTPRELAVRQSTGALVVAVRRNGELVDSPDPDEPLRADDIVYLVGATRSVGSACTLLTRGPKPDTTERPSPGAGAAS